MITIRKLLTKEIYDKFCETNILTDEDLVAYMDTYKALETMLSHRIFCFYWLDSVQRQSYGLIDRLKKINLEFSNSNFIPDEKIASDKLFDKFFENEDNLSLEEIKTIYHHLLNITKLIDFDPVRYFILNDFCFYKCALLKKKLDSIK